MMDIPSGNSTKQWKITISNGYINCKWPLSINMLNYQRVANKVRETQPQRFIEGSDSLSATYAGQLRQERTSSILFERSLPTKHEFHRHFLVGGIPTPLKNISQLG